jgi:hypothetical protein
MVAACEIQFVRITSLVLAIAIWSGCSRDEPAPSTDSNATAATSDAGAAADAPPVLVERHAHPTETVAEFLKALKSGDQTRATSMLTVKAQEEMARREARIQPPGSPTAEFKVTEFEFIGEDKQGAHVLSTWSDTEANGSPTTHEIVWILRRDGEGWAVAGFATQVFEDQAPLILNFEDPVDLQQKRAHVDAEIARRQQPAAPRQAKLDNGTRVE